MFKFLTADFQNRSSLINWLFIIALAAFLIFLSFSNYLLFHTVVELSTIVIAAGIFIIAWELRKNITNGYLLVIGFSFLFVIPIDFLHTMTYEGIYLIPGSNANMATQLWIFARYFQALSFLIAPLFINRKKYLHLLFWSAAAVLFVGLASILEWQTFPICFIPGQGLTAFKVISEYIISAILILSGVFLFVYRSRFSVKILRNVTMAILFLVLSEITFTGYVTVFDFALVIGHIFKLFAYFFLYLAIIKTGLNEPFEILFRELKESERRFRRLVEAVPDVFIRVNAEGQILEVIRGEKMVNPLEFDLQAGQNIFSTIPSEMAEKKRAKINETLEAQTNNIVESDIQRHGDTYHIEERLIPLNESELLIIHRDITDLKKATEVIQRSEERLRQMFAAIPICYHALNVHGQIVEINREWLRETGYTPEEILHKDFIDFLSSASAEKFQTLLALIRQKGEINAAELELIRNDGSLMIISLDARITYDIHGGTRLIHCVFSNITEQTRTRERLTYLATHDSLTDLPNRNLLAMQMEKLIQRASRNNQKFGVFFIDLDGFKEINDNFGHDQGDRLLTQFADRLRKSLRQSDLIARFAGDEFIIVAEDIENQDTMPDLAEKIFEIIHQPFPLDDHTVTISASIGAAIYPEHGQDVSTLLKNADQAMYKAKKEGKGRYNIFHGRKFS